MWSLLASTGARGGQLAVARGGQLVVDRAYTFAEENYLVALPTHLFRLGSISKPLTAVPLVNHLAPNGDIDELYALNAKDGLRGQA